MAGFAFRLSRAVDPAKGYPQSFEGVLKLRLAHAPGRSYILPEQLFVELGGHWRFFLPSFFGANSITFIDGRAIACDTSMDVTRPGQNRAVRLLIRIHPDQLRYSSPDGARLFGCTVQGPTQLIQLAGGRAMAVPGGDIALKLHHYTSARALGAIRHEHNLRASTWVGTLLAHGIVRVGLKSGCSLGFDDDHFALIADSDLRAFDYLVEGDAARLDGLAAPYAEENTEQVVHLERLPAGDDPFLFWSRNSNTDQVQGRTFEPRQLAPKGDEV